MLMLSPHEFATLMLVRHAPDQLDMNRAELDALLEQQLVMLEQSAEGDRRAQLTDQGELHSARDGCRGRCSLLTRRGAAGLNEAAWVVSFILVTFRTRRDLGDQYAWNRRESAHRFLNRRTARSRFRRLRTSPLRPSRRAPTPDNP